MICETEIGVCKCNVYKDYDEYSLLRIHYSLLSASPRPLFCSVSRVLVLIAERREVERSIQWFHQNQLRKKIKDLMKRIVHVILKWAVKVRNIETLMATIFSFLSGTGTKELSVCYKLWNSNSYIFSTQYLMTLDISNYEF